VLGHIGRASETRVVRLRSSTRLGGSPPRHRARRGLNGDAVRDGTAPLSAGRHAHPREYTGWMPGRAASLCRNPVPAAAVQPSAIAHCAPLPLPAGPLARPWRSPPTAPPDTVPPPAAPEYTHPRAPGAIIEIRSSLSACSSAASSWPRSSPGRRCQLVGLAYARLAIAVASPARSESVAIPPPSRRCTLTSSNSRRIDYNVL